MFLYTPARDGASRLYVTHNQGNKFNEFTGIFRGLGGSLRILLHSRPQAALYEIEKPLQS